MTTRLLILSMLVLTPLVGALSFSTAGAQPAQVRFWVDGPGAVAFDSPIDLRFGVEGADNVAGFEAIVLFDTSAAAFRGHELRNGALAQNGRAVGSLSAVEQDYGIAIGAYTCSLSSCVEDSVGAADPGGNGRSRLGTISLLAMLEGRLQVTFTAIKLVDAHGEEIGTPLPPHNLWINVGEDPNAGAYPSPGSRWGLRPDPGLGRNYDVVPDETVSYADAAEVSLSWVSSRERSNPCASLWDTAIDVNRDGCVDIADVQLVAANYGQAPGDEDEPPDDGRDGASATGSELAQAGATFVVNSTGDEDDVNIGNGVCETQAGTCTLRAAIREANTNTGPNTISFDIPGGGVRRIQVTRQLPALGDQSGGTLIDGYTQPGASVNTDELGSNANLRVELRGGGENQYVGLKITSPDNTIRGLSMFRFRKAIWIFGSGASNNTVVGSFIGTDAVGNYVSPVVLGAGHGIHVEQGAHENTIGRPNLADRNIISGNGRHGIGIWHAPSNDNVIQNNIVGLSPDGSDDRPNRKHGIDLNYGSANNLVGGAGQYERNVASGNDDTGVEVSHFASTSGNRVVGNFIGSDLTGNAAPGYAANHGRGIMLEDGVRNNIIENNVIVNNQQSAGIEVRHDYTSGNIIRNNLIGITLNGAAGPNPGGVEVDGSNTMIGPGNTIAFNHFAGVNLGMDTGDFNTITRNSIFSNSGLGINIAPGGVNPNDPGDDDTGPNEGLNFPVLDPPTVSEVTGTACGNCVIEIFVAGGPVDDYGQGMTFIASGSSNGSGAFSIPISGQQPGTVLTATATDQTGNTSEFAQNIAITGSSTSIKDMTFENGEVVHPVSGADNRYGPIEASAVDSLSGNYSAQALTTSPTRAYLQEDFVPAPDLFLSFELRIDDLPSNSFRILELYSLGQLVGNLGLAWTGELSLRNGSSLIGQTAPLQAGTTYRIGIHQRIGAGADAVLEAFFVEGTGDFGTPFAAMSNGKWTAPADRMRLGVATSTVVELTFDNVSLDTASMP